MNKVYDVAAPVQHKELIADGIYFMEIEAPSIAAYARPGQFVQMSYMEQSTLLRRPFSIAGICHDRVLLLIKMRGSFTKRLYEKDIKNVHILGPLGSYFPDPGERDVLLIAGGMGVAPLLFACQFYHNTPSITFLYGVKSKNQNCDIGRFLDKKKISGSLVCEENEGLVTDYLQTRKGEHLHKICFICGPGKMMVKTAEILYNIHEAYYSLETMMACGMGICLGCTISMKSGNKRVCREGPVFRGSEILWEQYNLC